MTRGMTVRPEMNAAQFGDLWRSILQKFGIWNPYTGTGAIKGLKLHGPHAIRHIRATDAVNITGGFDEAAALLFTTEKNVADALHQIPAAGSLRPRDGDRERREAGVAPPRGVAHRAGAPVGATGAGADDLSHRRPGCLSS